VRYIEQATPRSGETRSGYHSSLAAISRSRSGTAGPGRNTTAKVAVPRKKGETAIDGGDTASWDSFTGAAVPKSPTNTPGDG
jgi:hypothetical protein